MWEDPDHGNTKQPKRDTWSREVCSDKHNWGKESTPFEKLKKARTRFIHFRLKEPCVLRLASPRRSHLQAPI
ncbi:hypothetical protein KTH_42870 [Thermosporothrix hazakensis]|nr:hypothetical protein KTH_42870 [Thermosporothrix hazakensis]